MSLPRVASRQEWLDARQELLADEKAMTRARDALSTKRRELPMVKIDKEYVFEGPDGKTSLLDMFEGRRQLVVVHFMFDPSWDDGCPSCTAGADEVSDGLMNHLHTRDTTLAYVSRRAARQDRALQDEARVDVPLVLVQRQRLQLRLPRHHGRVRRCRSSTTSAPRQSTRRAERTSTAMSPPRCPDAVTSCATTTPSSTRTRCTPEGSSRLAGRTTCSTRPRSGGRRNGRNRRAAPPAPEEPFPTSPR